MPKLAVHLEIEPAPDARRRGLHEHHRQGRVRPVRAMRDAERGSSGREGMLQRLQGARGAGERPYRVNSVRCSPFPRATAAGPARANGWNAKMQKLIRVFQISKLSRSTRLIRARRTRWRCSFSKTSLRSPRTELAEVAFPGFPNGSLLKSPPVTQSGPRPTRWHPPLAVGRKPRVRKWSQEEGNS